MSAVEPEPRHVSRKKLTEQDDVTGYHFPVTSPQAFLSPAASGDVVLVFEIARHHWFPGPSRLGRPRADPRSCTMVSFMLLLAQAASQVKAFTAIETLVADGFKDEHPPPAEAVRGYRLWVSLSLEEAAAATTMIAQLLGGASNTRVKRTLAGETRTVVPGVFGVTYLSFYNEARLLGAIQAYTMGMYRGHAQLGLTYDVVAMGTGRSGGDSQPPDAPGPHSELSNDSFFAPVMAGDGAGAGGAATEPVLPESCVLASLEAARLFAHPLTANRHETWGLVPEQAALGSYCEQSGQLRFPRPKLVTVIPWGPAFADSDSLLNRVLPDVFPDVKTLARAVADSVANQGGDVWAKVKHLDMQGLLALFDPGSETPIADPTAFAPIESLRHWHIPKGACTSQGQIALAEIFPVIERTKTFVAGSLQHGRNDPSHDAIRDVLAQTHMLFGSEPDGVPPAYSKIRADRAELDALIAARTPAGVRATRLLYSQQGMRRVAQRAGCRMEYASVLYYQIAKAASDGYQLTQAQLCPFMLLYPGLMRMCWHTATTSFFVTLEGDVARGKSRVLEDLAASLPESTILPQGTRSAMADCETSTCCCSIWDDAMLGKDTGALQSEISIGARSHSRNEPHPSGHGYVVKHYKYVRNRALVISTNFALNAALVSRALRVAMLDNDAPNARSIMDLASKPRDSVKQGATSLSFKLRHCWAAEFFEQQAVAPSMNSSIVFPVIAVMRAVLGDKFTLTTRLLEHVQLCSIANMAMRVSSLWNAVLKPACDDSVVDVDEQRAIFYTYRAIVTAPDVLRAAAQIGSIADKRRYLFEVRAALRESIDMISGDKEPVSTECGLYYETDLPTAPPEIAERLTGMLTSFKAMGIVSTFLREIMAESINGHPVLKAVQPRGGGRKKMVVLKPYVHDRMVVAPRDKIIMSALCEYYDRQMRGDAGTQLAAVEFDEGRRRFVIKTPAGGRVPPAQGEYLCNSVLDTVVDGIPVAGPDANVGITVTVVTGPHAGATGVVAEVIEPNPDPWVVFPPVVNSSLARPNGNYSMEVPEALCAENAAALVRAMTFMNLSDRGHFRNVDEMGQPIVIDVATVFDPAAPDMPLVPPDAEVCAPSSVTAKLTSAGTGGGTLVKCRKSWQGVVKVRHSALVQHMRNEARGESAGSGLVDEEVFAAVMACEGAAEIGEQVPIAVFQQQAADGDAVSSHVYGGVPEGFSIKVANPLYNPPAKAGAPARRPVDNYDSECSTDDEDDAEDIESSPVGLRPAGPEDSATRMIEDKLFKRHAAYTEFNEHSGWYHIIETEWGKSITGKPIPARFRRSVADYAYEQ